MPKSMLLVLLMIIVLASVVGLVIFYKKTPFQTIYSTNKNATITRKIFDSLHNLLIIENDTDNKVVFISSKTNTIVKEVSGKELYYVKDKYIAIWDESLKSALLISLSDLSEKPLLITKTEQNENVEKILETITSSLNKGDSVYSYRVGLYSEYLIADSSQPKLFGIWDSSIGGDAQDLICLSCYAAPFVIGIDNCIANPNANKFALSKDINIEISSHSNTFMGVGPASTVELKAMENDKVIYSLITDSSKMACVIHNSDNPNTLISIGTEEIGVLNINDR